MGDFDKCFSEPLDDEPPVLGAIEELEMTVDEYHTWRNSKIRFGGN